MISTSEVVKQIIASSPFLEEGLALGLINNSALARQLKPQIEKKLYKSVHLGAVTMALTRLSTTLSAMGKSSIKLEDVLKNLGDITVRSNIILFTFENTSTLLQRQGELLLKISSVKNTFLTITDGVFETTVFASSNLKKLIEESYLGEDIKNKQENLSSITIVIPEEATYVPGVYYSILKKLAWEGINFIEVVSSYTELTIFLESKNVERAFSALKS